MANYALGLSDLKDKLTLDTTLAPKKFVFKDETVYGTSGQNGKPPLSQRWRVIRLTVNGVVVYDTNFRVSTNVNDWNTSGASDIGAGDVDFQDVAIPTNTDGTIVEGSYKIEINTLYANDDSGSPTYSLLQSAIAFDVDYSPLTASVKGSIDLGLKPEIKFEDTTQYIVDKVTPTLVRTLEYFDVFGNLIASTSGSSVSSNKVYTGTSSSILKSTPTWDFSTELDNSTVSTYVVGNFVFNLKAYITKRVELTVGDDANLCNVFCCVEELKNEWQSFLAKGNISQAEIAYEKFKEASTLLAFAQFSVRCGRTKGLNDVINQIKDLANCNDDCGCSDTPQLIPDLTGESTTNKVIQFNTGTSGSVSFSGGSFTQNNGSNVSIISSSDLTGKTFSASQRDFDVFYDGVLDITGGFDSSTGLYTFSTLVSNNVDVLIRIY